MVTADDRILFDDERNGVVGRLNADGSVTVLATGLEHPAAMVEGQNGSIFVAEGKSGRIVRIVPGLAPFLVRSAQSGAAGVSGLVIDPGSGDILAAVPGAVLRISSDGRETMRVAGGLSMEPRLALDPAGSILISDRKKGLQRLTSSGELRSIKGVPFMRALVVDRQSRLLFITGRNELWQWTSGGHTVLLRSVPVDASLGLDQADNLLVVDPGANRLMRMVTSFVVPQTARLRVAQGKPVPLCLPIERASAFTAAVTISVSATPPGVTALIVRQPTAAEGARLEITSDAPNRLKQGAIVLLTESGSLHQRVFLPLDFGG